MLDLNPKLVDQDRIRKLRRRRLLKAMAIPILILTLIGAFFLRTTFFNTIYSLSYENQNYNTAKFLADEQKIGNIIMPYIAYYDTGTIGLKREQYEEAEENFRESLKNNPPSDILCQIYVNLSLSIEKQADKLTDDEKYEDALVKYNSAQSVLHENGCANKNAPDESKDKKASAADTRIANKRSRAVAQMNYIKQIDDSNGGDENKLAPVTEEDIKNIRESQNTEAIMDRIRNSNPMRGGYFCNTYTNKCW